MLAVAFGWSTVMASHGWFRTRTPVVPPCLGLTIGLTRYGLLFNLARSVEVLMTFFSPGFLLQSAMASMQHVDSSDFQKP